eukprot:5426-Pelagococcus_subviridis.AAC.1
MTSGTPFAVSSPAPNRHFGSASGESRVIADDAFMSTNSMMSCAMALPALCDATAMRSWKNATFLDEISLSAADAFARLNPSGGAVAVEKKSSELVSVFVAPFVAFAPSSEKSRVGAGAEAMSSTTARGPSRDGRFPVDVDVDVDAAPPRFRFRPLRYSCTARSIAAKCPTGVPEDDRLLRRG